MVTTVIRKINPSNNFSLGKYSIWFVISIGFLLRLVNINAPVLGMHSCRQADPAAIARNYLENNFIFWQPQVDWSGATNGFVECEFPLYQYIVALLYKIFGFNEIYARSFSLVCSCITILLVYRIANKLFTEQSAWWGALFYAILPITVFYGRTIQPESLMMLLAAFCLERWLSYLEKPKRIRLIISWIAFTLCVLVKVLPMFWIGIPIFFTACEKRIFIKSNLIFFPITTLLISAIWYFHANTLAQSSGLTFGLWSGDTDRYAWNILLDYKYYLDLLIRLTVRNFLVLGLPLLYLGCLQVKTSNLCIVGILSVFLTGIINPVSFGVHEYYQLPLMLFACPLMGQGFVRLKYVFLNRIRFLPYFILILLCVGSLLMLKIDYWGLEDINNQEVWRNSELIKSYTKPNEKIVSVSGGDPTLLYLSDRKGWLASPKDVDLESIKIWKNQGAQYITGSWDIIESYNQFTDEELKNKLRNLFCFTLQSKESQVKSFIGCFENERHYLIRLEE